MGDSDRVPETQASSSSSSSLSTKCLFCAKRFKESNSNELNSPRTVPLNSKLKSQSGQPDKPSKKDSLNHQFKIVQLIFKYLNVQESSEEQTAADVALLVDIEKNTVSSRSLPVPFCPNCRSAADKLTNLQEQLDDIVMKIDNAVEDIQGFIMGSNVDEDEAMESYFQRLSNFKNALIKKEQKHETSAHSPLKIPEDLDFGDVSSYEEVVNPIIPTPVSPAVKEIIIPDIKTETASAPPSCNGEDEAEYIEDPGLENDEPNAENQNKKEEEKVENSSEPELGSPLSEAIETSIGVIETMTEEGSEKQSVEKVENIIPPKMKVIIIQEKPEPVPSHLPPEAIETSVGVIGTEQGSETQAVENHENNITSPQIKVIIVPDKSIPVECTHCGILVKSESHLSNHISKFHNPIHQVKEQPREIFPYVRATPKKTRPKLTFHKCKDCPRRYRVEKQLQRHQRVHNGLPLYTCNICNKTLKNEFRFHSHMRTHEEESKKICDQCGLSVACIEVHMKRHAGEFTVFCELDWCRKGFFNTRELGKHMEFHKRKPLEAVPYHCHICGPIKRYAKAIGLRTHLRNYHYKRNTYVPPAGQDDPLSDYLQKIENPSTTTNKKKTHVTKKKAPVKKKAPSKRKRKDDSDSDEGEYITSTPRHGSPAKRKKKSQQKKNLQISPIKTTKKSEHVQELSEDSESDSWLG